MSRKLIKNIGVLATATGSYAKSGREQGEISIHKDAAIVCENGEILGVYDSSTIPNGQFDQVIDAKGRLVTPGLVDSHTHLVFGGWREHEVPLKLRGASYLEILEAGGGIIDTVRNTRKASFKELYDKSMGLVNDIAKLGVTTMEIKSGYGLDYENELKQLEVIREMRKNTPLDICPTFMAAHAVAPEYAGRPDEYVEHIVNDMMPRLGFGSEEKGQLPLAVFCDVFCENSAFNVEQSRKVLIAGKKAGLIPKIHADEINVIGAVPLGVEMSAISADHLIMIDNDGINALAESATIATLLPSTSFYLGERFAPARELIKRSVPVAIASDFNPGSCPSYNLQLAMNLAYLKYRMTPAEILTAVTLNAACAVDMADKVGTIERGKQCDIVIWKANNLETLLYRFGDNMAETVIKKGEIIC